MTDKIWRLNHSPFEVQEKALSLGAKEDNFAYFKEMGMGKTATLLADFWYNHKVNGTQGLAVFCPNTLKATWEREIKNFIPQEVNVALWPNIPEKGITPWIWIANYESLSAGGAKMYSMLPPVMRHYRTMMALDESVKIKNPNAKVTKAVLDIGPLASKRRILSGKPIVQGPQDIWAQLKFLQLQQLFGYNFYAFRAQFCKMGGYMGRQVVGIQEGQEEKLYHFMTAKGVIYYKDDWLTLPKKVYTARNLTMTPIQARHYKTMMEDFMVYFDEHGGVVEAAIALTKFLKLQQISSGFIFNEDKEVIVFEKNPEKLKELIDVLESVKGKVLVPCVFRYSVDFLRDKLKEYNPVHIYGGMKPEDIEAQKKKFNEDDKCRVIICQSASAKYGHTLIGSKEVRCHTTYFYENSYSLDDRVQMEDRNHRIGQEGDSVLYIDQVSSPMEQNIVDALQKKNNIANAIMTGVQTGDY